MKTRSAARNQVRGRSRATTTVQRRATRPAAPRAKARSTSTRARSAGTTGRAKTSRGGRSGAAQLTVDHEEIRSWVEERGGHPATVKRSVKANQRAGILRIDFPGFSGAGSLKAVSWDEWFNIFDKNRLGFLHQDRTANGKPSRFNKIVCRK